MLTDTWRVRKAAGLLSDHSLSEELADMYRTNEITQPSDIEDDAIIADQARVQLFGDKYGDHVVQELNETIMELTRPAGAVQELLADHGQPMVLCSTRVRRKLTDEDGVEYVIIKTARFATMVDAIADHYFLNPAVQATEKAMERMNRKLVLATSRIPALTQRTPAILQRLNNTMQHQLPSPTPKKGGK